MPQIPAYELKVSLWDLDNCVSDDKWRTPLIDWHLEGNARYDRYDAQMGKDSVAYLDEWRLITRLSMPVFITGRREKWREITRKWVAEHLPFMRGNPARLEWQHDPLILMRPNDNNDKPVVLKRALLFQLRERHGISFDRILAAFDDVPSIVDMYLQNGIPATILRVHDPLLSYKKEDL